MMLQLCALFRCRRQVRRALCFTFIFFFTTYGLFFVLMFFEMVNLKSMPSDLTNLMKNYLNDDIDFRKFDNVTGSTKKIVPDIVHYIKFRSQELTFAEMLSIRSTLVNHAPEKVIIHCSHCHNGTLVGKYWTMLQEHQPAIIEIQKYKEPTHIFGRPLSSVYHASDIARIHILMDHGGIFLDNDVFVVQSLKKFLHYEFALGWPLGGNIGTQVLIGHKNARFPKLWLNSYRWYRPHMWYYNAGQLPTEGILMLKPELVHRVPKLFGVHYLINELYKKKWPRWKEYYTLHLLIRHRSYLDKESPIKDFNEENIKSYNFTFGDMARSVLYGTTELV